MPRGAMTLALAGVLVLAVPTAGVAQQDSTGLHTTLWSWAEDAWLQILDRDAARGGRLSDRGILQRFWPDVDPDYPINLMRMRFDPIDDDEWHAHARGARYWGGSINTRHQAIEAEFKELVPLRGRWSADVDFKKQNLLELNRSLVRLAVRRSAPRGLFEFVESTLDVVKPSSDIGIGVGWRRQRTEVTVAFTVLDAFTNLIYQGLGLEGTSTRDSALHYLRQPRALRTSFNVPIGAQFRLEGHGGVMTPTTIAANAYAAPDSGFVQDEAYAFAGLLLEWMPSARVSAGGFATNVRAVTDRTPLPAGGPGNDFRLMERTSQLGASLLGRIGNSWVVEVWAGRMWRLERRLYRSAAAPNVDYEDRSWSGQAVVFYRPARGFTGSVALDVDNREVLRGVAEVASADLVSLARDNAEVRFDFGWRFPSRSAFEAGLSVDLDPGPFARGWFGGGHGRFVLYW